MGIEIPGGGGGRANRLPNASLSPPDFIIFLNKTGSDESQTHKGLNRTLHIMTEKQGANFRGKPLFQATKRHLTKVKR